MSDFEPTIVAFCCHYCAYTAADSAGTNRISYPPNVTIIRVPCSGKVDTIHLLQALERGADGVLVAGCLDGDCHFKTGNLRAAARVDLVQETLQHLGVDKERLAMCKLSAGMGQRFAEMAHEMTAQIRALGPSPLRPPDRAAVAPSPAAHDMATSAAAGSGAPSEENDQR